MRTTSAVARWRSTMTIESCNTASAPTMVSSSIFSFTPRSALLCLLYSLNNTIKQRQNRVRQDKIKIKRSEPTSRVRSARIFNACFRANIYAFVAVCVNQGFSLAEVVLLLAFRPFPRCDRPVLDCCRLQRQPERILQLPWYRPGHLLVLLTLAESS